MERCAYEAEYLAEHSHWWYVGRRKMFARLIGRLGLNRDARTLDLGSCTGSNLRVLKELNFKAPLGIDYSIDAAQFCREKGVGDVIVGDALLLPFAEGSFDLVLTTDVIEHVDDDRAILKEIERILKPGGHVLITVPAFPSLWGRGDDCAHHRRRYRAAEVESIIEHAGLVREKIFYFNYILFIPIFVARKLLKALPSAPDNELLVNNGWINRILTWLFTWDVATAPLFQPPFGVSVLALARKPDAV